MFFILLLILRIYTFRKHVNHLKNTIEIPNAGNLDDIKYRLLNKVNDSISESKKESKNESKKEPKDNFKIDKSLKDLFTNPGPTSKRKIKSVNTNLFNSPSPKKTNGLIQKPFRSENYHYNKHKPKSSSFEFGDIDFY